MKIQRKDIELAHTLVSEVICAAHETEKDIKIKDLRGSLYHSRSLIYPLSVLVSVASLVALCRTTLGEAELRGLLHTLLLLALDTRGIPIVDGHVSGPYELG